MDPRYSIKPYLSSARNVLKALPDDLVGPTLENTKNSHEAVFIFDKSGKFLGLISPQQAYLFERCPYFTPVVRCLFKPPFITDRTPLYTVADSMLESKIYTLPVFGKNGEIKSVIKADTILRKLIKNTKLLKEIDDFLLIQKPITASYDVPIENIYSILLQKNISRVILVDHEGDLTGIVSKRDLENALIVKTPRQRYGDRLQGLKYSSFFDEEKVKRLDAPVSMFYTKKVLTAKEGSSLRVILEKMKKAKKNSVVLVRGLRPAGFVSRHDFLKAITLLKPKVEIPILWEDSKYDVGEFTKARMLKLLQNYATKFKGKSKIRRMEVHVDAIKNAAGYDKIFYIKLHVDFDSGRLAFANVETRDLVGGTREAIKRIENQFDLSDRQKHNRL